VGGVAPTVQASIRKLATDTSGVERVNELLTVHFGPNEVFVALSLDVENECSAAEVEGTASTIERAVKTAHPEVRRVLIEAQSFKAHLRMQRAFEDQCSS